MADWNKPQLTDLWSNFLTLLNGKIEDAAKMFLTEPTNPQVDMIRMVRLDGGKVKFQKRTSNAWEDVIFDITGGGTGETTGIAITATQLFNLLSEGANITITQVSGQVRLATTGLNNAQVTARVNTLRALDLNANNLASLMEGEGGVSVSVVNNRVRVSIS